MHRRLAAGACIALLFCTAHFSLARTNDVLGVYFDTAGTIDSATTDAPMQQMEAYLIILDPSHADGIIAWECIFSAQTAPDSYVMVEWELSGQALNLASAPEFLVGIGGPPLPWSEAVLLATATITVPEPGQEVNLFLHPFNPPSLDLNGYPYQVPAYSHGSGGETVPLAISSGCEAQPVARINPGEPPPTPTLTLTGIADFGLVNVGSAETATVILQNAGAVTAGGEIQLEAMGFRFRYPGGSYTLGPIWYHLQPGAVQSIEIVFLPSEEGFSEGSLLVEQCGATAAMLPVSGTGGVPDCMVEPDSLDFAEVRLGQTANQVINITSIGSGLLEIDLASSCPDFQILGGNEFVLQPDESRQVTVRFAPSIPGLQECTIYTGNTACGTVPCRGIGIDADPDCAVSMAGFDFGEILTGTSETTVFTITNTGGNLLEGEVALTDGCEGFALSEGAGPYSLGGGQTHEVVVEFAPLLPGDYTCEVETGLLCDNPVLTGSAREPVASCSVQPPSLDFGPRYVGQSVFMIFIIINDGDLPLSGYLSEDCGMFRISGGGGAFTLAPDQSRNVRIYYQPTEPGEHTCLIELGLEGCGPVFCEGSATIDLTDLNQVGIFFAPEFTIENAFAFTQEFDEVVTGYVVLDNLTEESGVLGWQLCLGMSGDATWIDWEVVGEGAVNADVPPCFEVNYPVPLPFANQVLLATFQVTVLTPWSEILLYTLPGSEPWLPDVPAFIPGGAPDQYLPMNYYMGSPLAGIINLNPIEVVAGPPDLNLVGASVVMSWHVPQAQIDGYHVFRREGQAEPVCLTARPLPQQSGRMTYTDQPGGSAAGAALYYSYAALRQGQEIARSAETMILWQGSASAAPALTRLHPCYPNPFNPLTHLRFDLGTAGPVVLAVFDLNGQRIKTLADETLGAGTYERLWEGRDDAGRRVASGTYYARLESQDGVMMRKMVLLK